MLGYKHWRIVKQAAVIHAIRMNGESGGLCNVQNCYFLLSFLYKKKVQEKEPF
jgi:hypothetical protein